MNEDERIRIGIKNRTDRIVDALIDVVVLRGIYGNMADIEHQIDDMLAGARQQALDSIEQYRKDNIK